MKPSKQDDSKKLIDVGVGVLERAGAAPNVPFGIAEGVVGHTLFACEWSKLEPSLEPSTWASKMVETFNTVGGVPGLLSGVAGMAMVFSLYFDQEELLQSIDEGLVGNLARLAPANLFNGLSGVALYASRRTHTKTGQMMQQTILELLQAQAKTEGDGICWHSPLEYFEQAGVQVLGSPVREFGMAHGVAGVVVGLAALLRAGQQAAAPLIRGALTWLNQNQRQEPNRYGWMLMGDKLREMQPDAWCTGESGVVRARWLGARACGEEAEAQKALEEARAMATRHTAAQLFDRSGSINMCCGSTMVAQIFRRFFIDTGEPVFAQASQRIFADCEQRLATLPEEGFQRGALAALLAIGSATHDLEPTWDCCFGISLPKVEPTEN